jgi:hypothetical protein
VTLAGITITAGLSDASSPIMASTGGGILSLASLILRNVVVSDNAAVATAGPGAYGFPGWAVAGGVASFGTLDVTSTQFTRNLARGGDGSSGGLGIAGAIGNWGSGKITDSQFTRNVAQGGDRGSGSLVGLALGGAIGTRGPVLTITFSTFRHNQAVGGNDNPGTSPSGNGLGGAIYVEIGMLDVSESRFDHNQAIGGNSNLPRIVGAGGFGGAIEFVSASGTISRCALDQNEALGGAGGSGANGGPSIGGGLNVADDFGTGSNVTISNSTVEHNKALGGLGGAGGSGADGHGGGLGSDDAATLTIIGTIVAHNHARGAKVAPGVAAATVWAAACTAVPCRGTPTVPLSSWARP